MGDKDAFKKQEKAERKRYKNPKGLERVVTGLADKMTGDKYDFDRKGPSKMKTEERTPAEGDKSFDIMRPGGKNSPYNKDGTPKPKVKTKPKDPNIKMPPPHGRRPGGGSIGGVEKKPKVKTKPKSSGTNPVPPHGRRPPQKPPTGPKRGGTGGDSQRPMPIPPKREPKPTPPKTRKPKYNPFGPGTANPSNMSTSTGP